MLYFAHFFMFYEKVRILCEQHQFEKKTCINVVVIVIHLYVFFLFGLGMTKNNAKIKLILKSNNKKNVM